MKKRESKSCKIKHKRFVEFYYFCIMTTRQQLADATFRHLPYIPNSGQACLVNALAAFAVDRAPRDVFVLNGYAGTGKTSVMGAFTAALADCKINSVVLAPTGRAAKVASLFSPHEASTIHKRIYRGNSLDPRNTSFFLARNNEKDTIFIVDEASMIPDSPDAHQSLLSQLAYYVYSSPGCAMILVGDEAQLPPVGQAESPALNRNMLIQIGLKPIFFNLDTPVRQTSGSGILYNATLARHFLNTDGNPLDFSLSVEGYDDIRVISSADLADELSDSWRNAGEEETLIITRSNKRANNYNRAIRNLVMGAEEPLQRGDRIIIAKNDYYWGAVNNHPGLIANGETAIVTWVGKTMKAYGRYFTDVELHLVGENTDIGAKVMLRSLVADGPQLPRQELERLYQRVMAEKEGSISEKIKFATEDPFYNSLQAKYAYCVTCHKAQGGQWKHVYIDMAGIDIKALDGNFFRWLYTALTRATERVYFINPPFPS